MKHTTRGWMGSNAGRAAWRCGVASLLVLSGAGSAAAQSASIGGDGTVRVCELDGSNVDSDGNEYLIQGDDFISGPPEGFRTTFSCLGRPQRFTAFQSADPKGDDRLGHRMVSQSTISVNFEPQFTDVSGRVDMVKDVCVEAFGPRSRRIGVLMKSRASRSLPEDCIDGQGRPDHLGACSSVRGRFGGFGIGAWFRHDGRRALDTFIDLTESRKSDWLKIAWTIPDGMRSTLQGLVSATLLTAVKEAETGSAFGDLRIFMEVDEDTFPLPCPRDVANEASTVVREPLPRPAWFILAGDAVPDDFTLAISPPTGPITMPQSFDLALMANTGGATLTGVTGAVDGVDVTAALAACLAPTGTLGGLVRGSILTCRGLSGGMLAGFFGTGPHTLSVAISLSDGRTITDSATWTILP